VDCHAREGEHLSKKKARPHLATVGPPFLLHNWHKNQANFIKNWHIF
jgi:hypothetical protein